MHQEPSEKFGCKCISHFNGYHAQKLLHRILSRMAATDISPLVLQWPRTAVVGAGPSGLAAAYLMHEAGFKLTLIEQNHAIGDSSMASYS